MTIYDCKCQNCKAEFQAVLEDEKEEFECPACGKTKIDRKKSDIQPSCGGGCGSCSKCS